MYVNNEDKNIFTVHFIKHCVTLRSWTDLYMFFIYAGELMKQMLYIIIFFLVFHSCTQSIIKDSQLFIAVAQGNYKKVEQLLNKGVSINTIRPYNGNTPLMEAIKEIGQALIEIEASSVLGRLSEAGNLTDDFRSFFRKFVVSCLLAYASHTIHDEFNKDDEQGNINNSPTFLMIKRLINAFLPAIEKAALMWCIYAFLDYGIAVGRHPKDENAFFENNQVNQLRQTIQKLLEKHNIDISHTNNNGESALTLIRSFQEKLKHRSCKLVLYQIEQVLLDKKQQSTPDIQ